MFGFAATRPGSFDLHLNYLGGAEAWRSGHPETLYTWLSTPFLGLLMALLSRAGSEASVTGPYNLGQVAVAMALIAVAWWRLRGVLAPGRWWLTLLAAVLFAPLSSVLWWKQVNLYALAPAVLGFELLRRGKPADVAGGALLGLSLNIKPFAILLPLAMLFKPGARRGALLTLGWTAAIEALAQAFLAWRAGDVRVLWPLTALATFGQKSAPQLNGWACNVQDFSPTAILCRLAGGPVDWDLQRLAVLAFLAGVAALLWWALSAYEGLSWELFAAACLVSPMLNPLGWSHYQLALAPMFVVVAARLRGAREALPRWVLLAAAYLLCEVSLTPYGTILGSLAPAGSRPYGMALTAASFAQYFLLAAAVLTLAGRGRRVSEPRSQAVLAENAG